MAPYNSDPSFPLVRKRQQLATQVQRMSNTLSQREQALTVQETQARTGLKPNLSEQDVSDNLQSFLPPWLQPGNLGDLNRIIWPFFFTFTAPQLVPNSNATGIMTVTQEAAFVAMSITKAVFKQDPITGLVTYVNPEDPSASGLAPNLTVQFKDSQSTRFLTQVPISLDAIGRPSFPTTLPTPILFLPNSQVEASFFNSDAANQYIPFVTLFGYRVRIDEAQNILSTVTD